MNKAEIIEQLTPLFRDIFENDHIEVSESLSAKDVAQWDSLANVRLFVAIELAFSIRFTSAEITGFQNVGEIIDSLIKKGV